MIIKDGFLAGNTRRTHRRRVMWTTLAYREVLDFIELKQSGFALLEVMFALVISTIVMLATVTATNNMRRATNSNTILSEMVNMLVAGYVAGDPCKSVSVSGGIPPLGACGSPNTPQTIQVLYKDGTPVHLNSKYLLQADCNAGFYVLQIKSALATKVDPLTSKALGVTYMMPASMRFAEKAWLVGGCP